jgi:hypothetical protein
MNQIGFLSQGNSASLSALCYRAIEVEFARAQSGEITELSARLFAARLRNHVIPAFVGVNVAEIGQQRINAFAEQLQRKLRRATAKQILISLRKVLKLACLEGVISGVPSTPTLKTDSVPRGAFSAKEYLTLWRTAHQLSNTPAPQILSHRDRCGGIFSRQSPIHPDLPLIIRFMVNCFVRPTDLKWMQHKHIQVVEGRHRYLRLELPESKRHTTQIVSMRPAVRLYKGLKQKASNALSAKPDDYVFLPEIRDRKIAMTIIDLQFRRVLEASGLRLGRRGQVRTLYSLRHTSIMFRLLYGRGIDLLTLARNARTSVEMIEKFYASELSAEMNIDLLHSRRTG